MNNKYFLQFEEWLSGKSHRDRLYLLFFGFALIFLCWYYLLEASLSEKKFTARELQKSSITKAADYEKEVKVILKEVAHNSTLAYANEEELHKFGVKFVSETETNQVIKQILSPRPNIVFNSWKQIGSNLNQVRTTEIMPERIQKSNENKNRAYELVINSDFFSTIDYLASLEKLPWCLAWDSLEYKVNKYPEATITINLRIINAM